MIRSKDSLEVAIGRLVLNWAESRSKDPRTKVGACIYDYTTGGMFFGYNGFPSGLEDSEDAWNNVGQSEGLTKYDLVIHAEQNALVRAVAGKANFATCCLVTSVIPCSQCMKNVIAANHIKKVFYMKNTFVSFTEDERIKVSGIATLTQTSMEQILI